MVISLTSMPEGAESHTATERPTNKYIPTAQTRSGSACGRTVVAKRATRASAAMVTESADEASYASGKTVTLQA